MKIADTSFKKKCADVFELKTSNTTISQVVTNILTEREEKSFVPLQQNLVSLAHDLTQYW